MDNKFGQESILRIESIRKNGKSELKDCYFTAPLKVAKALKKNNGDHLLVYIMNASAGMMEGDSYALDIRVGSESRMEITNQSYNKVHKMKSGFAQQKTNIYVEEGGTLYYLPEPTIPFEDSNLKNKTLIHLEKNSSLILWDIISCGRTKRNEWFKFKKNMARTEVYLEQKLVYLDNLNLEPAKQNLSSIGFFEGYSHYGNMLIIGEEFAQNYWEDLVFHLNMGMDGLKNFEEDIEMETVTDADTDTDTEMNANINIEIGFTRIDKMGIVVRCLANSADGIKKNFREVIKHLKYPK